MRKREQERLERKRIAIEAQSAQLAKDAIPRNRRHSLDEVLKQVEADYDSPIPFAVTDKGRAALRETLRPIYGGDGASPTDPCRTGLVGAVQGLSSPFQSAITDILAGVNFREPAMWGIVFERIQLAIYRALEDQRQQMTAQHYAETSTLSRAIQSLSMELREAKRHEADRLIQALAPLTGNCGQGESKAEYR